MGLVLPAGAEVRARRAVRDSVGHLRRRDLEANDGSRAAALVHLGVLSGLLGALAYCRLAWVRQWLRFLADRAGVVRRVVPLLLAGVVRGVQREVEAKVRGES